METPPGGLRRPNAVVPPVPGGLDAGCLTHDVLDAVYTEDDGENCDADAAGSVVALAVTSLLCRHSDRHRIIVCLPVSVGVGSIGRKRSRIQVALCLGAGRYAPEPPGWDTVFATLYPVQNSLPGVEYRQCTVYGGHTLLFRHWLVCLAFSIATIATSVGWLKKPTEREPEAVG